MSKTSLQKEDQPTEKRASRTLAIEPYWAMEEASFAAMKASLEDGIQSGWLDDIKEESTRYEVRDGVAVVSLTGPMSKRFSFWSWLFGGVSTESTASALRRAANDQSCHSIMLLVDSPGGSVAGVADLAAVVADVNKRKRVCAYADDMCASAAYWVASQADTLFAGQTAMVGSIGTYMVVTDYSKLAQGAGMKVHVVKAGEFKGAGTPGTEITDAQLAEFQRIVNQINANFVNAVAQGLNISASEAAKLNDGRCHVGVEALKMGLVDEICTLDQALAKMQDESKNQGAQRQGGSMAKEETAKVEAVVQPEAKDADARNDIASLKAQVDALTKANEAALAEAEQTKIALAAEKRARELEAANKEAEGIFSNIPGLATADGGNAILFLRAGGEMGEKILGALKASNEHMKASETLKNVGSPVAFGGGASDIYGKVAAAVAVARKNDPSLSEADATAFVFRQDRSLYEEYRSARN